MKKIIYVFILILMCATLTRQYGWAESIKNLKAKFTQELVFGDNENLDQLLQFPGQTELYKNAIYILDSKASNLKKYDMKCRFLLSMGREGNGPKELAYANYFTICKDKIYISNTGNSRIEIFNPDGTYSGSFKLNQTPNNICSDSQGNLLICFRYKNCLIHKYTTDGKYLKSFVPEIIEKDSMVSDIMNTVSMAITPQDDLFVVYTFKNKIEKYNRNGERVLSFERSLDQDYEPIQKQEMPDGGIMMKANGLHSCGAYKNNILYVLHSQKTSDKETIEYCDMFDNKGKCLGRFIMPIPISIMLIDDQNNFYLGNADESTVHKYKVTGLPKK